MYLKISADNFREAYLELAKIINLPITVYSVNPDTGIKLQLTENDLTSKQLQQLLLWKLAYS